MCVCVCMCAHACACVCIPVPQHRVLRRNRELAEEKEEKRKKEGKITWRITCRKNEKTKGGGDNNVDDQAQVLVVLEDVKPASVQLHLVCTWAWLSPVQSSARYCREIAVA